MAPNWMLPWGRWHSVVDSVDANDPQRGARILAACGRWNSERHLREHGVLADRIPPRGGGPGGGKLQCVRCEGGYAQGHWTAQNLRMDDGTQRLHLRTASGNGKWHFVHAGGAVSSVDLGGVYLTTCGQWMEQAKVKVLYASGKKPTSGVICKKCLQFDGTDQEPGD